MGKQLHTHTHTLEKKYPVRFCATIGAVDAPTATVARRRLSTPLDASTRRRSPSPSARRASLTARRRRRSRRWRVVIRARMGTLMNPESVVDAHAVRRQSATTDRISRATPTMTKSSVDDFCHLPRDLSVGDVGGDVHCLQRMLRRGAFSNAAPSGRFDDATREGVKRWTKANGWTNRTGSVDASVRSAYAKVRSRRRESSRSSSSFLVRRRDGSRLTDETRAGERLRDDVEREIGGRLREREKRRRSGVRGRVRGIRGGFAVLSNQVRASRRRR